MAGLIGGCRELPGTPPPNISDSGADAGEIRDAGTRADAGADFDAGEAFDAGDAGVDAGTEVDAGSGFDAGTKVDAGVVLTTAGLVYSPDRTQSPIDRALVQRLRDITSAGTGRHDVFARVGDSVSIGYSGGATGGNFLNCFDGILEGTVSWDVNIRLGSHAALAPTIHFFKTTPMPAGYTCWSRISLATRVGVTASWPMASTPSPIDQELAAINPRFAVVLYGSNDIGWGGMEAYPVADQVERYEKHMRRLTDHLISRGVVPILNTMPPDGDYFNYVPAFAGVVRAIAQGRQVPMIDLYKEMIAMGAPYGLRSDRTHPSQQNYNTCCWFDPTSLATWGANLRNLITLEALDRMRQVFEEGVPSLDPGAPRVAGDGTVASPISITQVPWGELRDLRRATVTASGTLSCPGAPAVTGPQNLYRLVLTRSTALRVLVLNGGLGGHQVSLLTGTDLGSCVKSDPRLISTTLAAGTYYIAVDALSATSGTEYNFSVTECIAGDPEC